MHGFPYSFHSPEGEGQVRQPSTHSGSRQGLLGTYTIYRSCYLRSFMTKIYAKCMVCIWCLACNIHQFRLTSLYACVYLNCPGSPDEVNGKCVVFLHSCANSEDVRVKDDVISLKSNRVDQKVVSSCTDVDLTICIRGLKGSRVSNFWKVHFEF